MELYIPLLYCEIIYSEKEYSFVQKNLENVNVNNVYLKEVPDAHAGLYLLVLFAFLFKVANKDT